MNVRKRGLALLMCICMIFTLLPFSALAEGTQPFTVTEEKSVRGAEMRKTVTQDSSDPDKYTVTLEQWATGTVSTKQKPLDIVLVLDVSGSMDDKFGSGNTKKIASLKKAVNSFIDSIASKATDEVTHKIAIVKFAGDKTNTIGNEMYTEGFWPFEKTYNHTQIVKSLTLVKDNTAGLKNAVNALSPAGATAADWGLEKAKEAFGSETADPNRQRVVIMFTDGEPNHGNGFDNGVANAAIGHANSLKNKYSSLVYTIGIFSGANVSDMNGRTNRYMNLVSSNYPNATDMNTYGTGSNQGYYKKADNADELQSAFDNISTSIGQSGSSLDSTAVLTDVVAPNFKAPKDVNEVKLYTAAYSGTSFGDRTEYTDATVNIGENGAVTVTGFDYSANFVTNNKKADGTYGKKLIVEFTITVDREKTYGGTQPTNAGAKIDLGDETIIEVANPQVPVSIDYEFNAIADKTKTYDGSGFNIGAEIGGMLTNNPPVGTKNGHVTITYTITDSDGKKIGTYTIPAGQATGTWEAAEGVTDTTTPADAGEYKYTVKCTMSDATTGENSAAAVEKNGTAKFIITQRSVTLTSASDNKIYDGTALTNDTVTVTGDGFVAGEGATYNVTGSQTDVGESDNEFTYTLNEGTKAANYEIKTFKGNLKVTPITDEVVVTITGNNDSKVYNGTEQSVTGFTTDVGTKPITVTLKEGSKAEAKGTDVDKYMMGLTVADFTVTSKNYSNIKVVVVDGYLDITPITDEVTVKITGNTKTVTYNGTEQSVTGYTTDVGTKPITVTLKEGSKAEAKGTDVHKYMMGLTEEDFNVTSENYSNIKVVVVDGYLDITPITDEVTVKITGNTKTVTYNGTEQSVTGYTTDVGTKPITVTLKEGSKAEAKGTDVHKYMMGLTEEDFNVTSENYSNIKVVVVDGYLDITPITDEVTVKITGNTKTVTYNGTEQSVTGYTTDVGTKPITVTLKEGSKAEAKGTDVHKYMMGLTEEDFNVTSENYSNIKVVVVDGYLEITPIMTEVTVKITGNNKTVTYNGKEQSVEGYVADTNGLPITVSLATGKTAFANGTEVGTYKMNLAATDFVATSDIYGNIKIVIVEDGWLKINRRPMPPVNPGIGDEITVEITGSSDSVVYDGAEHSVKDYTVKISDPRYTEADFTFTGKAEASGVNAGTYEMGLKAEQFKNTNARFTNVKFVIKADGVLTITPKDLTITAGSKTEYGPTPVTCDEWTVSGLVAGDKVESVKITGIQSVPGSSPNVPSDAVIKNAKGEDVTKNYAIKYVNGTLTMLEVLNKEDHFNYIIGTPEGLSLPTANVTRAEVATIFFRLMTDDARAKFDSLDNNFSDVAKGKWYNRAISTLAKAGIIKGDPAGTYRPDDPITRAEMAAIIARFGDFKEGGKTFSDISGHWAQKYIELAASNGWINGNPDGTFKPNNNITRAETVAMINRVLNRQTESNDDLLPVSQMTNWSDNMDTAKWYYRDMQEATNNHKAERVGTSMYEKWTEKLPDIDWASYQI